MSVTINYYRKLHTGFRLVPTYWMTWIAVIALILRFLSRNR